MVVLAAVEMVVITTLLEEQLRVKPTLAEAVEVILQEPLPTQEPLVVLAS
jgi:hypothetical protein